MSEGGIFDYPEEETIDKCMTSVTLCSEANVSLLGVMCPEFLLASEQ